LTAAQIESGPRIRIRIPGYVYKLKPAKAGQGMSLSAASSAGGGHGPGKADERHLDWLESQRRRKRFNLGDYDVQVAGDEVIVSGKTSDSWQREKVLERSEVEAEISTESRTPVFIFYLVYAMYAVGFLMFFVSSGITPYTQLVVFAIALVILFTPLVLESMLPTKFFLAAAAVFFILVFSLPGLEYLSVAFKSVESAVGKGHVEEFLIFASIFPILLRRMIGQMMVSYRLKLEQGGEKFEVVTESPSAVSLVEYLKDGYSHRSFFKMPSFFLNLSRKRMKSCHYCGEKTLTECHRCNRPVCDEHTELLRGFKVCLDCYIDRRGKIKRNLR